MLLILASTGILIREFYNFGSRDESRRKKCFLSWAQRERHSLAQMPTRHDASASSLPASPAGTPESSPGARRSTD